MTRRCLGVVGAGMCALAVLAQEGGPSQPEKGMAIDPAQLAKLAGGPGGAGGDPSLPDFAAVTKDMKSQEGLFTLWFYPADAKDKDQEKLLCQIPAKFLGEQFMLSTSFSGGGFLTGFPLDERVVQWQVYENQLVLVEPETRFVVDKGKEVGDVVRRTYPERIRAAVPLVTKTPAGDPVIDFGTLLKSNFADILWTMGMSNPFAGGARVPTDINPRLSKWTKKKTFELNVEIGVELALSRPSPPGSYDKKLVHFSFWKLPATDFQPRVADDRVGYFMTANQDWAKPTDSRDIFNRYINRWHLVKRDSSLAVCEPRQPIIFFIEKTVPVKFRRAVREGILEWNKAYEKVGFVNAVEVRQQTADNEWKDLDPEDMRYSFFRWIVTGAGFAMGPSRANPFTGQIYDADIIFDDSMVRYFQQEAEHNIPAAMLASKFNDPALQRFLKHIPEWQQPLRDWEFASIGGEEDRELRAAARRRLEQRGLHCCDYADGMKHQMRLGHSVLAGAAPEAIEAFLFDMVKEVVMHEVGHTLGLRHNFKASSIYTLEEIQARRKTGEATTGSVMDYNPALLFARNTTEGRYVTPTIGSYDYWAIEYGYKPFDPKEADKPQPPTKEPPKPGELAKETGGDAKNGKAATPAGTNGHTGQAGAAAAQAAPPAAVAAPKVAAPASPEEGMLRKIASRASEPELAYATDEDTTGLGPDPRTNRFDLGRDPVESARDRIELVNARIANILEWSVKDQESWYHLRDAYMTLLFEKATVLDYVGRYIGGQYFNRAHRGDPQAQPPFVLVEPQVQRDAMKFIEDTLFVDSFFGFKPDVLNHLAPPRWYHEGAMMSFTVDFPVMEIVATLQAWNLMDRLFPNVLQRIHDAEMKTEAPDKFTAAEYIQRIQNACWSDAVDPKRLTGGTWNDATPFITPIRRSLQREYLRLVEPIVRQRPGTLLSPDLHAMMTFALQRLADSLTHTIAAAKADFATQAHLTACKSRIDRMLSAELREIEPRPVQMTQFMQSAN